MKKGMLCIVSVVVMLYVQVALAQAVQDTSTIRSLDEIAVVSERLPQFRSLMHVVTVMERSDIEQIAVQNIQDLLRYVEGVDLRARGGNGVQADVFLRGGTFDQTIVLLNGMNISDPQTGHHSLDIPINLENIQRIEVLQGPGAWSFGAVAYSGAINIITDIPDKSGSSAGMIYGAFGYQNYHAAGNISTTNIRAAVSANSVQSDGYAANTGFDINNVYVQIACKTEREGTLSSQFGYQNKDFGAQNFYSPEYNPQFEHTRTLLSGINYTLDKQRWGISATAYFRRHYDSYELFHFNPASWYTGHNYHRTDVTGFLTQFSYARKIGTTSAGFNYRYEHIYSNNLGDSLTVPLEVNGENTFYTLGKMREHFSVFLQHTFRMERLNAAFGFMGAGNSAFGFRAYLGGNVSFDITPQWQVAAAANNSYRVPTFTDLYYSAGKYRGSIDLKPEEAVNGEFTLRFRSGDWRVSMQGFYRYGYRIISWVRKPDNLWHAENITNIATYGTDIHAEYAPQKRFFKKAAINYAYLYANPKTQELVSYTIEQLSHLVTTSLQHSIYGNMAASWQLLYKQRAGVYKPYNVAVGSYDDETKFKPFWLCNLKIYWDAPKYNIFVEAENLFNVDYFDFGNIPQSGRWLRAGFRIKI